MSEKLLNQDSDNIIDVSWNNPAVNIVPDLQEAKKKIMQATGLAARPLVLYHAGCSDGFCAAWVARQQFGDDADYQAINYGDPVPNVIGREVYVLDFSFKRPVMLDVVKDAARVCVLDHHESAARELAYLTDCSVEDFKAGKKRACIVFDMKKSGARLTWDYFFPEEPAPALVDFTEDRDLWLFNLPESRAVNMVIQGTAKNFESYWLLSDRLQGDMPAVIREGNAILGYQAQLVRDIVAYPKEVIIGGRAVLLVNAPARLASEVCEKLAAGRPFGASYCITNEGKILVSLRVREGNCNASDVARGYGGGGHKAAAGFSATVAEALERGWL